MKCKKCGGNLSLEDVVCPYCDELNEHAIQHIRDMNRYKREFQGTKDEVYSVTKRYAGITVRAIIIAVLVVLIVIFGLISERTYTIKRNIMVSNSSRNITEYMQTLDQFLEDRNYNAFHAFCEEHYIHTYDDNYDEYNCLIYATSQYCYIYEEIMEFHNPYDGSSLEDYTTMLSELLEQFYKIWDDENITYYSVGDSEKNRKYALEIQEQIHALLITYCGLTEEDVKELPSMTSARRSLLLEEKMGKVSAFDGE